MGFWDFFKKKPSNEPDPIKDLTLSNLKEGYYVDYDMKTWKVEACHYYDWGEGDITYEWQLKSFNETIYLEKETDDEDEWRVSRTIPIGRLGTGIIQHIKEHEDPPEQITFDGKIYHLEEMGGGYFYERGKEPKREFLCWDYVDDSGEHYLTIEQWGENAFEASVGIPVEEYQFSNILPA